MPTPSMPSDEDWLIGVAAVSATDVWAMGRQVTDNTSEPLFMHFDGSGWAVSSAGDAAGPASVLLSINTGPDGEVWAVGTDYRAEPPRPLAVRWDGHTWRRVGLPLEQGYFSRFNDVAVVAADDVWAVGGFANEFGSGPLIQHWDGSQWTRVTGLRHYAGLRGVTAVAPDDVWAVGGALQHGQNLPYALHWDGTSWNAAALPRPDTMTAGYFNAVAAASSDDVWAVGDHWTDGNRGTYTLTEHWDGEAWSVVPSPSTSTHWDEHLSAITIGKYGERWAVGSNEFDALAIRRCDGIRSPTRLTAYPVIDAGSTRNTAPGLAVSAQLESAGSGVPGVPLAFDLGNGASCTAITDASGLASCPTTDALAAATNEGFAVTFAGNSFFGPSHAQAGLT